MVFEAKIRPEALYTWQGIQLWTTNIGFLEEVVKICKKRWKLASWPWSFFWVRVWSGPKNGTKKDWRCSQWWQSTNIHLGWSYIDLYKQTGIKEQQLPKRSEKIRIPNRKPFVTLTQYMIHHYHSMPHRGYMTWTNSSNSSCKTTINHHKSWGVGWAWPGILQLMALQFLMHINGLPIVICTGYYQGCFMAWQLWIYESMILTDNPWNLNPGFKSCCFSNQDFRAVCWALASLIWVDSLNLRHCCCCSEWLWAYLESTLHDQGCELLGKLWVA